MGRILCALGFYVHGMFFAYDQKHPIYGSEPLMSTPKLLLLFKWSEPRIRTLHFTWLAFFITFVMWFAFAPLMPMLKTEFGM